MKFLLLLFGVYNTISLSNAIECNFRYVGNDDPTYPGDDEIFAGKSSTANNFNVNKPTNIEPFDCDEPKITKTRIKLDEIENDDSFDEARFNFFAPVDDDYETIKVCETRNQTIRPKSLTTINNELVRVLNTIRIVQEIETEECWPKGVSCSEEFPTKNFKSSCVQKYSKISLQAFNERLEIYNEPFYFPSACACAAHQHKR